MDGAFWGVIAGIAALVFGRVLWLALRPATATEVSGVSADDEALFLPEAATGAEGVLSRFFVECELNWTPGGFVAWCIALVGASYLLASFWGISEGWFFVPPTTSNQTSSTCCSWVLAPSSSILFPISL